MPPAKLHSSHYINYIISQTFNNHKKLVCKCSNARYVHPGVYLTLISKHFANLFPGNVQNISSNEQFVSIYWDRTRFIAVKRARCRYSRRLSSFELQSSSFSVQSSSIRVRVNLVPRPQTVFSNSRNLNRRPIWALVLISVSWAYLQPLWIFNLCRPIVLCKLWLPWRYPLSH